MTTILATKKLTKLQKNIFENNKIISFKNIKKNQNFNIIFKNILI